RTEIERKNATIAEIALFLDHRASLLERLNRSLIVTHLFQCKRPLEQNSHCSLVRWICRQGFREKVQGLLELPLMPPQGGFEVEQSRTVEDQPGIGRGAGFPEPVGLEKGLVG